MKKFRFLLSCLIVGLLVFSAGEFLFVDSVYADQTPPDGPDDHGIGPNGEELSNDDCEENEDNVDMKDPVSVTGGKIFIPEVDLELNGNGKKTGITYLNFKRSFSSQSNQSGGLGRGWVTNCEMRLEETDVGATIYSETGEVMNYLKLGDASYIRPECGTSGLSKEGSIFTCELRFGSKYIFEASTLPTELGKYNIKYIEDRYGNRIDFEYQQFDDQSLGGLVNKPTKMIETATGKYIQINWQEYNNGQENLYLISSIEDSAARTVSYEYDLDFNLYKGSQANLKKVTDPEGNTQEYDFIFEETPETTILKSFNITDKRGNVTIYNFNQPFESSTHFPDWNWNLRVESVVDPNGNIMSFSTDETLGLTTYIDKMGNTKVYEYSRMLLDKVTYSDGKSKQFFYDAVRNRIKKIDENNNEWNYTYDGLNRLRRETDPLGNFIQYYVAVERDYYAKWSQKIDKNGNTWTREINCGSVMSETDPLGNKVSYTYDAFGNVLTKTDARGNSSSFVYDNSGNMTSSTDAEGNTSQFTYDSVGNMLTATDALDNTTTYTYDRLGRMLSKISAGGSKEEYTYDGNGNVLSVKDANNNINAYEYDGMNQTTAIHLADGTDITYDYNAMGKLIAEHKPNGTWTYEYDARNRLIKKIDPLNNATVFIYDGAPGCGSCGSTEQVSTVTDALGNITSFEYDPLGRKIIEKDANNKAVEYQYNPNGNLIKEIDKLNHQTNYAYDQANRLISVTNHLGDKIEISYDPNSNKTQVKDPKGNITTYAYDKDNRNTQITDALGSQTLFAYDVLGNRLSITDAENNITQFEYDAENRLIKLTDAAGVYEQYEYDKNNNVIKKTNSRNQDILFAYDKINRLVQKQLANNQIINYSYDEKGNLASIADNIGLRAYQYDSLGRVINAAFPGNLAINYDYDAVGNRKKLIYPSGTTVNYTYNNLNLLSTETVTAAGADKTFSYSYDDKGRKTQLTYPNGIITTYAYDDVDRLLNITTGETSLPGSIELINYTYDANSNRTQRTDNAGIHSYAYDKINQLVNVRYPEGTNQAYTFDYVGNRTNLLKTTTLDTENITAQFNQLNQLNRYESSLLSGGDIISLSGTLAEANIDSITVNEQIASIDTNTFTINDLQLNPGLNTLNINAQDKAGNISQASLELTLDNTVNAVYGYDPDGNLISNSVNGTTWNYSWDAENRLISAASSLGKNIEYTYYEDGNLGSKTTSDTTKYIYDGIHCIAKYDASNQLINEIVYGPQIDEVLCSIDSSDTAHYYHQDALQSVTVITDGFANKSTSYEYDVYGKIKNKTGSFKNEITYTGRWLDEDTGLHYYRARWYDAEQGRFISRDPIGFSGGINLYGYVGNGVIDKGDPSGLSFSLCDVVCNVSTVKLTKWLVWICDVFCPQSVSDFDMIENCPLIEARSVRLPDGSYLHKCRYNCQHNGFQITQKWKSCNSETNCDDYYEYAPPIGFKDRPKKNIY
ncbi:MAG: RHS repeat-associated core domain-containing protein [Candidatus Omnitrophota bacterium]